MTSRVELLYDGDCPNVEQARAQLLRAFAAAGVSPRWQEWRMDDPSCPARLRRFGSPTVLVAGHDVAGETQAADASCCRVYDGADGRLAGVPPVEHIAAALRQGGKDGDWKLAGIGAPALGVALLPKLVCPACWPAYAAAVTALGMTFLLETRYLLPITVIALGLAVLALGWRSSRRRGLGPAALAVAASAAIIVGKFGLDSSAVLQGGVAAFVAAFIWNFWPRRDATGQPACPDCETPGASPSTKTGDPHGHQTPD